MLICYGMRGEPSLQILSWLQLHRPLHLHLVLELVNEVVHRQTAETRLLDLITLENVIFISALEILLTTAALPAASRETPGPTGGGGTKQPSRRRFSYLPS